jgi:chaperone required for assembly of F1-ATPase
MVLAFAFAAQGTSKWTADRDYVFTGALTTTTTVNACISTDPSLTPSVVNSPTSNFISTDLLQYIQTTKASLNCRQPILAGSTLFVSVTAQCSVIVYLEEPILS